MAFQEALRAWSDCAVHPVTRPAFSRSEKTHTLDLKLSFDQTIQIDTAGDYVPSQQSRRAIPQLQRSTKLFKHFPRKERDLALVVLFVIEEAIAANPPAPHAA